MTVAPPPFTSSTPRTPANITELQLPPSSLPRPGDRVLWYQNTMNYTGTLLGHRPTGEPRVQLDLGGTTDLPSYDCMRLEDPFARTGPNWTRLPEKARIYRPLASELASFRDLLDARMAPGPKYSELFREIWARGFEVFLVGGTVRDVIAGDKSKDIDLVTTMPLSRIWPLLQAMYRERKPPDEAAQNNGHVRIGGTPYSGEPFIDLTIFKRLLPGTSDAVFADDIDIDYQHRDFACNSIYYDAINEVLIDPVGDAVDDAAAKRLRVVADPRRRTPFQIGQMIIRFFKFTAKGFGGDPSCCTFVLEQLMPGLAAMTSSQRIKYIRTQVLSKHPVAHHTQRLDEFKAQFSSFGAGAVWDKYIEPLRNAILATKVGAR